MQQINAFLQRMREETMLEIKNVDYMDVPEIVIIGIGGGGNNALDRMIASNTSKVKYIAINTDVQVLNNCQAEVKIQIGEKLTKGYGAGAAPEIGEAAAIESEDEIRKAIEGADLCILTCGMGGGTGTGAVPVVAKYCRDIGALTIAVVTMPFSFESMPRILSAENGIQKLRENVDTLLVIPNDKLIGMSEKQLLLEDAFLMADSVLKYTIEGITNIIYNRGVVNIDFNDLKTTLANKGLGHLGIGTVDAGTSLLEAVKQAINSPLLDVSIVGATNLLINTCGKINLITLNEAINYVRELVGGKVNVIWGTVANEAFDEDKIVVTLIATGMPETGKEGEMTVLAKESAKIGPKSKTPAVATAHPGDVGIEIPSFLLNSINKRK